MKAKVTEQGVTIPKAMLPDVDEVDIRRRNGMVEVVPVDTEVPLSPSKSEDIQKYQGKGIGEVGPYPLMDLVRNPIHDLDITDASVNLDKYLYGE